MKTKSADAEKQAVVVAEAVEKAKAEASNSTDSTALQKHHAEELRRLEKKLTLKHEADLKTRVDSAVAEALKAKPTPGTDTDQKAAIEAAIAEYDKQVSARHAEEIASSAVDRGRMEQDAKGKLKDSQLVKAQKRVKELEASIHEWEAQGIKLPPILSTAVAAPATAPAPSAASPVQTAANLCQPPQHPLPALRSPRLLQQARPQQIQALCRVDLVQCRLVVLLLALEEEPSEA
jgi:nucleoprotein TPR